MASNSGTLSPRTLKQSALLESFKEKLKTYDFITALNLSYSPMQYIGTILLLHFIFAAHFLDWQYFSFFFPFS